MIVKSISIDYILDTFKGTNYHLICQATMGFTTLGSLENRIDISREILYEFTHEVNRRKEVGTLFPVATLSCMPVPEKDELNDYAFYRKNILDAIALHKQHIKTESIVFIFDRYGNPFEKFIAESELKKVAEELQQDDFSFKIECCIY